MPLNSETFAIFHARKIITLSQSHQSGISGTGCFSCVNKVITRKQAVHGCSSSHGLTAGGGSRGLTTGTNRI